MKVCQTGLTLMLSSLISSLADVYWRKAYDAQAAICGILSVFVFFQCNFPLSIAITSMQWAQCGTNVSAASAYVIILPKWWKESQYHTPAKLSVCLEKIRRSQGLQRQFYLLKMVRLVFFTIIPWFQTEEDRNLHIIIHNTTSSQFITDVWPPSLCLVEAHLYTLPHLNKYLPQGDEGCAELC